VRHALNFPVEFGDSDSSMVAVPLLMMKIAVSGVVGKELLLSNDFVPRPLSGLFFFFFAVARNHAKTEEGLLCHALRKYEMTNRVFTTTQSAP